MGFHGELVFGRSVLPVPRWPVLGRAVGAGGGAIAAGESRPGGWQTARCARGALPRQPPAVLRDMVGWTGAPACVVSVYGGRYALARGLGPTGGWWEAWLNLDTAAAMLAEVPDDVDDISIWSGSPEFAAAVRRKRASLDAGVPTDARGALAWARSAGFAHGTDSSRVEAVLRSRVPSAESLLPTLLTTLGFPAPGPVPAQKPVPRVGPARDRPGGKPQARTAAVHSGGGRAGPGGAAGCDSVVAGHAVPRHLG